MDRDELVVRPTDRELRSFCSHWRVGRRQRLDGRAMSFGLAMQFSDDRKSITRQVTGGANKLLIVRWEDLVRES